MPLAWVDEIAGLEPAINFLQGKEYTSKLWPYNGVEEQFLAYLPLQGWLHIVFQKLLGFSIYLVRLPYALFLLTGAYFFYKGLRHKQVPVLLSLALLVLIFNEKSLFETIRGIRVEPIAFLLISLAFYGVFKDNKHLTSIAISFLLILHPYVWPVALILFIGLNQELREKSTILAYLKPNIYWFYPASILILYLVFIDFNIELFLSQFTAQIDYHQTFGGFSGRLYNHFIERFWPYYFSQPFVPLVIYLAFIASIYKLAHRQAQIADVALVFSQICWLIAVGPMHRYNCVLFILSIVSFIPYFTRIKISQFTPYKIILLAGLLAISSIDVVARQVLATTQRVERNPYAFISWLNKQIPEGQTIISGHEIAYYQTAYNSNQDFFLFNTEPYRFNFDEYENRLILSYDKLDKGELLATYNVRNKSSFDWINRANSLTYDGINLYQFKSASAYQAELKILKSLNTAKNNQTKYD